MADALDSTVVCDQKEPTDPLNEVRSTESTNEEVEPTESIVGANGSQPSESRSDRKEPTESAGEEVEKLVEIKRQLVEVEVENAPRTQGWSMDVNTDELQASIEPKIEEHKGAADNRGAGIKEYLDDVEEMACTENGADAPAERKQAAEVKTAECHDPVEKLEEPVNNVEVPEHAAPVTPLVLVLAKKGQARQTVEFVYKPLGFHFEDSHVKVACVPLPCGRSSKSHVRVSKLEADQQAAALGVESDAIIYQVNGKDIADAKQLQDLIEDHLAKLPEATACN